APAPSASREMRKRSEAPNPTRRSFFGWHGGSSKKERRAPSERAFQPNQSGDAFDVLSPHCSQNHRFPSAPITFRTRGNTCGGFGPISKLFASNPIECGRRESRLYRTVHSVAPDFTGAPSRFSAIR